MKRILRWPGSLLLSLCLISGANAHACEVALALTVDVSGSVDQNEYALQMNGLATALRDDTVSEALIRNKAAVMLIQWTGTSRQQVTIPWRRMTERTAIEQFANDVESAPRRWRNFSTAIGEALNFARAQFDEVADCKRKVIDVSGDGYSNEGPNPLDLRIELESAGFTVNGLAIEGSDDDLTNYYKDNVIAGPRAFVMTANNFDEYPRRIKRKLLREVTNQVVKLEQQKPARALPFGRPQAL